MRVLVARLRQLGRWGWSGLALVVVGLSGTAYLLWRGLRRIPTGDQHLVPFDRALENHVMRINLANARAAAAVAVARARDQDARRELAEVLATPNEDARLVLLVQLKERLERGAR